MATEQTRAELMDAAIRITSRDGVRAVTARAVAAEAGVNQALVFYHFEGVEGLLREAYARDTSALIAHYSAALAHATTFADLHRIGLDLAERSRADGSASLLAQVIAAAHTDAEQARLLAASMQLWRDALGEAVQRVFATHGVDGDVEATISALAAAAIGMISIDAVEGTSTLGSVAGLASLADRVLRLVPAPLARRILDRTQPRA